MLFVPVALVILYSLATFGSTPPANWFLLGLLVSVLAGAYLVWSAVYRAEWHPSVLTGLFLLILGLMLPGSPIVLGLLFGSLVWVVSRYASENQTLRFLKLLVVVGVAEAVLGLTQHFVSPGWIFGYINPHYRVSGTLINRNHFAGLLEMLIPAAFGLAYVTVRRSADVARSYLYLLTAVIMSLAVLFSVSRMGIIALLISVLFVGLLVRARRSQRRLALGFTLTFVGLVAIGALWLGVDAITERYSYLIGEDALLREGRILVYQDTIKMILAHPMGTGTGSYEDRFREYQTFRPDLLFDHAHNDYLETAVEWGVPIAVAFWLCIALAWLRAVRLFLSIQSPEQRGILLACIGAMTSILIHSLADFNLQIPSNSMLFFGFIGMSLSVPSRHDGQAGFLKNR